MAAEKVALETITARTLKSISGDSIQSKVWAIRLDANAVDVGDSIDATLQQVHDDLGRPWRNTINMDGQFEHLMDAESACHIAERCMDELDRVSAMIDVLFYQWRTLPVREPCHQLMPNAEVRA